VAAVIVAPVKVAEIVALVKAAEIADPAKAAVAADASKAISILSIHKKAGRLPGFFCLLAVLLHKFYSSCYEFIAILNADKVRSG
jgi:hypothetical protein